MNRKHWTCSVVAASFMSEVIRFWSANSWGIFIHFLNLLWAASGHQRWHTWWTEMCCSEYGRAGYSWNSFGLIKGADIRHF